MRDLRLFVAFVMCACLAIVHSGCNVTTTMPQLRYQTPEVGSAGSGHALLTAQQATEVVLVPSTLATPPVTSDPKFQPQLRDVPGFTAAVAASNRVELSIRTANNAPVVLAGKYQIAGVSASEPRDDRFSCAVLLGGGAGQTTETDEASTTDLRAESQVENYSAEAGVLAGRRFGMMLPYGGVYYARYWADGSVEQGADRYPFDGTGGQLSLNAGIAATIWHVEARIEMARSFSDWESEEAEESALGVALGATW